MGRYDGAEWTVEVQPDGRLDVKADRRIVQYDCDDLYEAQQILRRNDATTYTLIDIDGYRSKRRV